jgi:sporulation protein YlmC with PRC-barrel domain
MTKILAKSMFRKAVTGMEGTELGTASNIIIDTRTGELIDLVIKPNSTTNAKFKMEGNIMYIPFASVRSARDYIVIDTKLAKTLSQQ